MDKDERSYMREYAAAAMGALIGLTHVDVIREPVGRARIAASAFLLAAAMVEEEQKWTDKVYVEIKGGKDA